MNLLLDTHAFLWFIAGDFQLGDLAKIQIENPDNLKFVSIASLWEIGIKLSLGKLVLQQPFKDLIPHQLEINGFELLHIQIDHVAKLTSLPFHHRDPFDRILASQCLINDLPIVSCDPIFDSYSVNRIWSS